MKVVDREYGLKVKSKKKGTYTTYCMINKLTQDNYDNAYTAMLLTKASPICARRIVDINRIDDQTPLHGVCNYLRFLEPQKRYEQCDDVPKDVQQSEQTETKPKVLSKAPTNQLDVAMKAAIEAEVKAELEQTVRQRLAESEKSEVEADINELNELIERARVDFEAKKAELAKNDKETERDEAGNAETDKQFATEQSQLDEQMDKLAKERDDYVQDKAENESKLGELKAMRVELADLKLTTRYIIYIYFK